jgi:phosphohistidine phosphatase SixA
MGGVTVYLARHGQAEGSHPGGDEERALTEAGREHLRGVVAAAGGLATVTRVVCSPFRRTRETARLWADAFRVPVSVEVSLASGSSSGSGILELAWALGEGVLLVGHNPEMGGAVSLAAGQGFAMHPGTVAAVALEGPRAARLLWSRS